MTSAFQPNAFQNNAFQILNVGGNTGLLGGGPGEDHHGKRFRSYQENWQFDLEEGRARLKEVEQELSEAEQLKQSRLKEERIRLKALREEKTAAMEMAALEASLQEEISRLRMERVWLMRIIDDEEAIIAILLSYPLH